MYSIVYPNLFIRLYIKHLWNLLLLSAHKVIYITRIRTKEFEILLKQYIYRIINCRVLLIVRN